MNIQIRPLHNRVLVKLDEKQGEVTSPGGIVLPESAKESPIMIGIVVGVGEGTFEDGTFVSPSASIGDKVIFGKYAGANVDEPMGFENYMIVRDADLLAVINETHEETVIEKMSSPGSDYGLQEEQVKEQDPKYKMNIEIFELKYLQFIVSSLWNFICFVIILLVVTNSMKKLLIPVSNFFKNVRIRYKRKAVSENITDKIKGLKPDILNDDAGQ